MSNQQNDNYNEQLSEFFNDLDLNDELLSNCCGATPFGELFKNFGRCSDCLEMAEFSKDEE